MNRAERRRAKKLLQGFAKKNPNSRAQEMLDYMDNGHTEHRKQVAKHRIGLKPMTKKHRDDNVRQQNNGTMDCLSLCNSKNIKDLFTEMFKKPLEKKQLPILYKIDPVWDMLWIVTKEENLDSMFKGDRADVFGTGKSAIREFKKSHLQQAKDKYGFNHNQVMFLAV